jgi:oligosaccharide repeat unit polymerase
MELLIILCVSITGLILGRLLLKRWYNHLTTYSFCWMLCLGFYTFRLIQYYRISSEAWFYIGLSWFMLYLGSFVVIFAHAARHKTAKILTGKEGKLPKNIPLKFLSRMIIILSIISLFAIIYEFVNVLRTFGNIGTALLQANELYEMRVSGELQGIPYLSSFPLATACLAGIYTALRRKLTFLSILPFILIGFHGLVVMGRTNLVIGGALFVTALLYTPHKRFIDRKTIFGLISLAVLALGIFTLICSVRGLIIFYRHESEEMTRLRSTILFLPSIYFYLTAPPVAFSEYLYVGEPDFAPGSYTFKTVYNVLTKFNLADPLPPFNPFIKTPEAINAGTYLRELHADFGPLGILFFPYLLGVFLTMLFLRVRSHPNAKRIVILAHLFALIWLSWDVNLMRFGQWAVSLVVSLFIAWRFDLKNEHSFASEIKLKQDSL